MLFFNPFVWLMLPPLSADTDTNHAAEYFKGLEWKKQMGDLKAHMSEMKKHFDSPEWKKKIEEIKANSKEIEKQFQTPEWNQKIE